jgi:hypothetical protein
VSEYKHSPGQLFYILGLSAFNPKKTPPPPSLHAAAKPMRFDKHRTESQNPFLKGLGHEIDFKKYDKNNHI